MVHNLIVNAFERASDRRHIEGALGGGRLDGVLFVSLGEQRLHGLVRGKEAFIVAVTVSSSPRHHQHRVGTEGGDARVQGLDAAQALIPLEWVRIDEAGDLTLFLQHNRMPGIARGQELTELVAGGTCVGGVLLEFVAALGDRVGGDGRVPWHPRRGDTFVQVVQPIGRGVTVSHKEALVFHDSSVGDANKSQGQNRPNEGEREASW